MSSIQAVHVHFPALLEQPPVDRVRKRGLVYPKLAQSKDSGDRMHTPDLFWGSRRVSAAPSKPAPREAVPRRLMLLSKHADPETGILDSSIRDCASRFVGRLVGMDSMASGGRASSFPRSPSSPLLGLGFAFNFKLGGFVSVGGPLLDESDASSSSSSTSISSPRRRSPTRRKRSRYTPAIAGDADANGGGRSHRCGCRALFVPSSPPPPPLPLPHSHPLFLSTPISSYSTETSTSGRSSENASAAFQLA